MAACAHPAIRAYVPRSPATHKLCGPRPRTAVRARAAPVRTEILVAAPDGPADGRGASDARTTVLPRPSSAPACKLKGAALEQGRASAGAALCAGALSISLLAGAALPDPALAFPVELTATAVVRQAGALLGSPPPQASAYKSRLDLDLGLRAYSWSTNVARVDLASSRSRFKAGGTAEVTNSTISGLRTIFPRAVCRAARSLGNYVPAGVTFNVTVFARRLDIGVQYPSFTEPNVKGPGGGPEVDVGTFPAEEVWEFLDVCADDECNDEPTP